MQTGMGRFWLIRALVESGVILFGLLAAFAINQSQHDVARAKRTDALMAAIRIELEANLDLQLEATTYNTDIAEKIWGLARAGETVVPADLFPFGLLQRPALTSAAWDVARVSELDEVPMETLIAIAAAYGEQRDYLDSTDGLLLSMYATAIQHESAALRVEGVSQPLGIGGMLGNFGNRGARLVERYQIAIEHLNDKERAVR